MNPGAAAAPAIARHAPCLLVNPRSFGNSRASLGQQAAQLARARGSTVMYAADPAELAAATDRVVANRQQSLLVLGGDGTVQAVVERLASLPADARPQLFVLGGGRSNVTAGDFGGRGEVLSKLETALRRWRDGPALGAEVRHVLHIEQPPAPVRHGFLLAAGWLDHIIRTCHGEQRRSPRALRHSDAGTAWGVLKVALAAILGAEPVLDSLGITVVESGATHGQVRSLLATTLQKHHGPFDPFARRGEGTLRFTALAARGPRMWLRLPWLATGRFSPHMDEANGYFSGRCDALRVLGLSRYTLDGEELDADPARPLTIRKGPAFTFLTL